MVDGIEKAVDEFERNFGFAGIVGQDLQVLLERSLAPDQVDGDIVLLLLYRMNCAFGFVPLSTSPRS